MTIYIATVECGKGIRHITEFINKTDLAAYVSNYCIVKSSDNINDLLELIYDTGMGFGQRYHHRISRNKAVKLLNQNPWVGNKTFLTIKQDS